MSIISSVSNLNLSISYNVGAGNFSVNCASFSYNHSVNGVDNSITATIAIRNRSGSGGGGTYFSIWQSGLIYQVYSRVHTTTGFNFIGSVAATIPKSTIYSYLNNSSYVWYMEWYGYFNSTSTSCGTRFGPRIGYPYSTQESAHDEVKDPSAPSNSFINVTNNFTPIASATVLSGSYSACGNSLSWTQALNTDGYKIYKSTNGGAYSLLATVVGLANTTYVDTAVVVGTTYAYKVETYNSVWFEDAYTRKSNIISGTISSPSTTISSVVGTECSLSNTINWTDSLTCETGYRVFRSTGGTYSQIVSLPSNTNNYIDSSILVNQIYYYKIAVDLPSGSGTGNTVSNTITFNAPSGLTISRPNNYTFRLNWLLNTSCENQVLVERSVNGGAYSLYASLSNGTTTYDDTSLTIGYTYDYRIRVSTTTGQYSAYSNIIGLNYNAFYINEGANNIIKNIDFNDDNQPLIVGDFTTYYDGTSANRIAGLREIGSFNTGFTYGTGFNGNVNKVIYDTTIDKYYVGGDFTTYNGSAANYIVRINPNGSLDNTFTATTINGAITAMALSNSNDLYISANQAGKYIVRLNPNGTEDSGFNYGTSLDGSVYAIAVDGSNKVFIGGDFTTYKGLPFYENMISIEDNGDIYQNFPFNAPVYAIVLYGSYIYVGGDFTSYGGISGNGRIRGLRLLSDGTYDGDFYTFTGFDNIVRSILIDPDDGNPYFAGDFTVYATNSAKRMIKLRATNASPDPSFDYGTGFNDSVHQIKFDLNGDIFAVGAFTTYNSVSSNRIVKIRKNGESITYPILASNETILNTVVSLSATQVQLNWNTNVADQISINNIYRKKVNSTGFVLITTAVASATTVNFTESITDDYQYYVEAVKTASGSSVSDIVTLPYNVTIPVVNRTVEKQLDITWTNTSPFATDIEIWRSVSGGSYSILTSISLTTSYSDINLFENTVYSYKLKYKSGSSSISWFGVTGENKTYLNTPLLISIVQPFNGVKSFILNWNNYSAYSTSFEVFRRALSGGGFSSVGTTTGTSFLDTTVSTFGETYEYYVVALSAGNESAPSNTLDRILENVTMVLDYRTSYEDNLVTRETYLFWTLFGSCTGNTYSVHKSYDGVNYTVITATTATTYTDSETFTACQECTSVYYYVTIQCIGLIISNVVNPVVEPPKNKWNMGGLSRLWIGRSNGNITYDAVNATYVTLDYYGNNIMTLTNINGVGTWYELPVSTAAKYSQKMVIDKQGYTFSEILELEIPKLNPAKWATISDILDDDLVVAFQTNNGDYCIMGYDAPAKIQVYNATTEDSKYNFTVEVRGNYNLMKFLDKTYVQNFIL